MHGLNLLPQPMTIRIRCRRDAISVIYFPLIIFSDGSIKNVHGLVITSWPYATGQKHENIIGLILLLILFVGCDQAERHERVFACIKNDCYSVSFMQRVKFFAVTP